ncbi:hypothetical protein N7494_010112 [Penicillium frequentans]|uniref:Uncharacterized protein n=1 Tax=Penicillium frequentans TaxID=3151616 RepID=A0AAD6CR95_9EURO|nr:hypothetical protein N7494_010112 [Penicillium glabrum]
MMEDWTIPYLGPDEWEKDCDGLLIKWTPKARENLQNDAIRLRLDVNTLKAVAENLAWYSANKHGEKEVLIRGSVHSFTTSTRTRRTRADGEHVSVSLQGGGLKGHIYFERRDWSNLNVVGESFTGDGMTGMHKWTWGKWRYPRAG